MEFRSRFSKSIDLAKESIANLAIAYRQLAHGMQSGVAMKHAHDSSDGTPKHLRVGINAAQSDQRGLVMLLISKGLITEQEYYAAMTEAMALEVEGYEDDLSAKFKKTIRLG